METLKKNILDIIITEVNSINEKVKGLNFLEILKINLISKILPIVNNLKFPLDQLITKEYKLEEINEACDDLQNGRISGRSIINFDD